ncbi:MAG: ABC transporter ATP-binding protein, partial [Gaiellales bacterium]
MLTLRDVSVRYGETTAVDDVSIDVADGEVVALLGPSGCGKSTLLRAIAGIEPIASGEMDWDGVDLAKIPVHRRGFGLMFQDGVLFPHRSVAGNVGYGLQGKSGWSITRRDAGGGDSDRLSHHGHDAASRVAELLDMVGLAGYGDRRVDTLSGGEAQRVALARALAPNPRLLLLDEPLAALDTSLRGTLLADLAQVLDATGTTAIFVTHDQDEAFAIADRIALMREGRIVQVGTPHEVWSAPVDGQAATFLGRDRQGGRRSDTVRLRHADSRASGEPLLVVAGAVIQDGQLLIARRTAP